MLGPSLSGTTGSEWQVLFLLTGRARQSFTCWVKYDFWLHPSNTILTIKVRGGSLGLPTSATAIWKRMILFESAYNNNIVGGWTTGPLRLAGDVPIKVGVLEFCWALKGLAILNVVPLPVGVLWDGWWAPDSHSIRLLQMLKWWCPYRYDSCFGNGNHGWNVLPLNKRSIVCYDERLVS